MRKRKTGLFSGLATSNTFIYPYTYHSLGEIMPVIVKSKVKEICGKINVGGDFTDALDKKVEQMVKDAIERAKANNRRTIMAKDI